MDTFKRIFTGPTFWLLNASINLLLAIIAAFTGISAMLPLIVMWISLATYEIIKNQEKALTKE